MPDFVGGLWPTYRIFEADGAFEALFVIFTWLQNGIFPVLAITSMQRAMLGWIALLSASGISLVSFRISFSPWQSSTFTKSFAPSANASCHFHHRCQGTCQAGCVLAEARQPMPKILCWCGIPSVAFAMKRQSTRVPRRR